MLTDKAIKNRKTQKVLADSPWPISKENKDLQTTIEDLLGLAASAPYHYKCNEIHTIKNELTSCLPWRFYIVDSLNCRNLLKHIAEQQIKAGKISNLLAATDALLLVTWLPEPNSNESDNTDLFSGNLKNMEHIAACSAAIQNVLIGATARNIPNYWSSGGVLRNEQLNEFLKIPSNEILLGALFLFPEDSSKRECSIKLGALREKGKEKDTWSKWLAI